LPFFLTILLSIITLTILIAYNVLILKSSDLRLV